MFLFLFSGVKKRSDDDSDETEGKYKTFPWLFSNNNHLYGCPVI